MEDVRLSIRNLDKSFATPVLKRVNLSIACGEIHAVVGENGAGKTTLVNILTGLLEKDGGELTLDGDVYEPGSPAAGFEAGVSFAAQELSTIGTLSVAENIALRNLPHKRSVIQKEQLRQQAEELLLRVGLVGVSPDTLTDELSLADRQLVELAKALSTDCRLLILDEPTAALTGPQAERLHEIIREIAAAGASIIYISHRLDDVLQIADTVTVLRDGRVASTAAADSMSVPDLMEHMTGRRLVNGELSPVLLTKTDPAFDVRHVTTGDLPHAVSLTGHRGEIIGIAGLAGSGKSELLQAIFGLTPLSSGSVTVHKGRRKIPIENARHAVKTGMGYLGEDRQSMGIYPGRSVLANMMLPGISRVASRLGLVDRSGERRAGHDLGNKLAIKCDGLNQDIGQLSGGNQQKALIARWLHCDSDILLFDEPTRGVDVGTKNAIYELFFDMQKKGKTIVVASSEIEELMTVCNRILVLSDRKLVKEFDRDEWSEADILKAAFQEFTSHSSAMNPQQSATSI